MKHAAATRLTRAQFLCAATGCAASVLAPEGTAPVVVLTTSTAGPYGAALTSFRNSATGLNVTRVVDLSNAREAERESAQLRSSRPALLVAFGQLAVRFATEYGAETPILCAMVMGAAMASSARPRNIVSTLLLDLPAERWLPRLAEIFPGKRRIAVLTAAGAAPPPPPDNVLARASRLGFSALPAECPAAPELLATFEQLKGRADFVWCAPANPFINATSIKPLVLTSLRLRLPLIGFSESFVRAGAACGFYADPADIGRRAAELARLHLRGEFLPAIEPPRVVRAALNDTVCRLIGLRVSPAHVEQEWLTLIH